MSKTDNFEEFLEDIAEGIRVATGTVAKINAQDMRSKIESIPKIGPDGGITPSGSIYIDRNGKYDVTGYESVEVNITGGGSLAENIAVHTGFATSTEIEGSDECRLTYGLDLLEAGLIGGGEESTRIVKVEVYNTANNNEYYDITNTSDMEFTDDVSVYINMTVQSLSEYKIKITYDSIV